MTAALARMGTNVPMLRLPCPTSRSYLPSRWLVGSGDRQDRGITGWVGPSRPGRLLLHLKRKIKGPPEDLVLSRTAQASTYTGLCLVEFTGGGPAMPVDREPRLRVIWSDPVTGRRGYAVIDRWVNGLAGGGLRMREGITLEEVERLARTMTYKNGAFNLPGGGAKGGLDIGPSQPESRGMLSRYVRAMRPLFHSGWGTAEDLGVTQETLNQVFEEQGVGMTVQAMLDRSGDPEAARRRVSAALKVEVEGIGLADCIGGYGVAEAAAAAATYRGWEIARMRAVVQGFGSMGGSAARYLERLGARVVGVVDVRGMVVNPSGLDVEGLLRGRSPLGEIDRASLRPQDIEVPGHRWLDVDAEILVPAAVGDVITAANADRVRANLVVEAANIPTTPEAQDHLHGRGVVVIPDYVANGGANAWWWWTILGTIEAEAEQAFRQVSATMRSTVDLMLTLADTNGSTPRAAADQLAMENLARLARAMGEDGQVSAG
jgi:glutamate dehydrogenase (NAD(P)+)